MEDEDQHEKEEPDPFVDEDDVDSVVVVVSVEGLAFEEDDTENNSETMSWRFLLSPSSSPLSLDKKVLLLLVKEDGVSEESKRDGGDEGRTGQQEGDDPNTLCVAKRVSFF